MEKVILFGATGNLGKEIAKELVSQGYELTIVVRDKKKAEVFSHLTSSYMVADACNQATLENICHRQDIVVSALGKSVSLNDTSKPTFRKVDYEANTNLLNEALRSGVKKFVYISALHSEKYPHLEYFKAHQDFSELLKKSGLAYLILKPPALFCAFADLIDLAGKGQLVNLGKGDKRTNPIYEGDFAKITVDAMRQSNATIEAGGKSVYTRRQINEIIQSQVNPGKTLRTVPVPLLKFGLALIKPVNKNMFDKLAFFMEVTQHDTLAPPLGLMTLEDYVKQKVHEKHGKVSS